MGSREDILMSKLAKKRKNLAVGSDLQTEATESMGNVSTSNTSGSLGMLKAAKAAGFGGVAPKKNTYESGLIPETKDYAPTNLETDKTEYEGKLKMKKQIYSPIKSYLKNGK